LSTTIATAKSIAIDMSVIIVKPPAIRAKHFTLFTVRPTD